MVFERNRLVWTMTNSSMFSRSLSPGEFKPVGAITPVAGPLAGGSSLKHEELS